MKTIITTVIIFFLISINFLSAQVTQEWVANYNGVGIGGNLSKKCMLDKSDNIIIVGRSENLSFNDDFITLKYNPSGNLLWEKRYNGVGNGDDAIVATVLDDSNNIYVTGYSYEGSALGGYNWVTIKYFPNGDTAWKRSFNWTANSTDEPFSITKDKLNNIYICGYGRAAQPIDDDFITLKYNPNGDLIWTKVYDSQISGPDRAISIAIDDSANVYPIGYSAFTGGNELITIKYNSNGDEQWIRKFSTLNGDYLRPAHVTVDKYNNIIVNGYYYLGGQYAFNTIKYNSDGDLLWNRLYKGAGNLNFCFALCTDDSANVYAAGRNTSTGTGNDFLTIKYNQYGDTSWIRIHDGGYGQGDEVRDMVVDNFQNVYVTGSSDSTNGLSDYLTIMYNSDGIVNWIKKYDGFSLVDRPYSIVLDRFRSVIISGYTQKNANDFWITTIKYSLITNTYENSQYNSSFSYLSQNYPNPFNPNTKINYYIANNGHYNLKVYDLLGKVVDILVNEEEFSGEHSVTFNGSNYSSGIYYYSLFKENTLIQTKRMILIK